MKLSLLLTAALLSLTFAAGDSDAARRFGGGSNLGKQRSATSAPAAPAATPAPAKPAQAAPVPTTPPPKPSFMSRWGGLIAGLGMGALIGSLFSGGLGGMGGILTLLLIAGVAFMAWRAFASRRTSTANAPVEFAGVGNVEPTMRPALNIGGGAGAPVEAPAGSASTPIPGFETEPFLRVARTSFIRLQAANDAKDLDDIRDYTTPEMFAEISMQVGERGDAPQKTEVVSIDAKLVEAVVEGDYAIASVRYTGLIRESAGANPEPVDEIWHVRKSMTDRKATWLIAGIQQVA
ncbi:MAG: Tim44 domain-containing protein [Betaproteobacteria bacterium]|nr:Tim44 domain-containing protein [Betaproteobacteria bacterium]